MHAHPPPLSLGAALVLSSLLALVAPPPVFGDCPACSFGPGGGSGPNVRWTATDSVAACPGGDSVVVDHPLHPHASRLRVAVEYFDSACLPRAGVPPDSIWVTFFTSSGNLVVNDKGAQVFADDSTDACGVARITIPSLSGCGATTAHLYVAGVFQGSQVIVVRTTDTDASGRTATGDAVLPCDVNYDSASNGADAALVNAHADHWRRNALHGTLVRRTSYCETCPFGTPGTRGGSEVFWSPSGRYISHTQFVLESGLSRCKVFIVPSDPKDGNALTQFSFEPYSAHDYDPSWSPRNDFIAWDRRDKFIIRKRVPWSGDPTEFTVTTSDNPGCGGAAGDAEPAISPNGEWVAFTRCNPRPPSGPGGWSLWKVPIGGGTAIQLTPTEARTDFYPSWSADGQTIFFQRQDAITFGDNRWTLWKVPASGGTAQQVFIPLGSPLSDAVQPAISPDNKILLMGHGVRDDLVRNVVTNTLDPTLPSPSVQKVVPNYSDPDFAELGDFPLLSPRLSPDGTRATLGSKQIWAARRNMNLPPRFTSVTSPEEGTRSIPDTAATMSFVIEYPIISTITVLATDPEADALTYEASFLETWMIWNPATRSLTLNPALGTLDKTYYVKFWVTTASGGTDSFIAAITVVDATLGAAATPARDPECVPNQVGPPRGQFALATPQVSGVTARLAIFDLTGRRVSTVLGRAGQPLMWEGKDDTGILVPTGVYLYRLEVGAHRQEGKFLVIR